MFVEPRTEKGWVEVICGSMFSGKTEELIRRINRAKIANQKVRVFKPAIDVRYDQVDVVSHKESRIESIPVSSSKEILNHVGTAEVVGIDEAQFFDYELPEVCNKLAEKKVRVIIAGLDMDFKGLPFGPMPTLLAISEYVTKVHAICMNCGGIAGYTFKKVLNDQTVELGEKELYEARCRSCFNEGMALLKDQMRLNL